MTYCLRACECIISEGGIESSTNLEFVMQGINGFVACWHKAKWPNQVAALPSSTGELEKQLEKHAAGEKLSCLKFVQSPAVFAKSFRMYT